MVIDPLLNDKAILEEIGQRLARRRIDLGYTQAALADEAGVSKRTVERIESGGSTQVVTMIRVFRVLQLLDELERLIPATGPRPFDLLHRKGKERQRASSVKHETPTHKPWSWDDN